VKPLRVLVAALIGVVGAVIGPMPKALACGTAVTPTWAANDVVRTIVNVNGITYLGGRFTSLIGPDGATVPRAHLAALGANGDPLPWDPGANGSVTKMAVSGSTLYVGGLFRTIDGHSQPRLAAST
jgi:hypothetical protein